MHENYGIDIIRRKQAKILDTVATPKKTITGVPYYMVLANPLYQRDF
jgi:hypothetical protein